MGAVTSTFIAGVEAVKQGLGEPIGSLTQLGTIRLGKRTEARTPRIKDFVSLAPLQCLSFGSWDIYEDNAYEAAVNAKVPDGPLVERLKNSLSQIKPMKAVFDQYYVKRINGPNVKSASSKMELAEAVMEDIRDFKRRNGCTRLVMIWCGSTEVFHKARPVHQSLAAFEKGLGKNDPENRAQPNLCVCGSKAGRSLRQWRAELDCRRTGDARTLSRESGPYLRKGL